MTEFRCCLITRDPGPWTAGVDDSADPPMVRKMHDIRNGLSNRTPIREFIQMLRSAVQIDSRTRLGGDIQRCLLSGAAHRLTILALKMDPDAIWKARGWPRLKDAWAVFQGRAVVVYVKE
jgi:hypothetical protein